MADVSTHDIHVGDKNYILEWHRSYDGDGYITITEACSEEDQKLDIHDHETYDFKEVE